MVLMTPDGKKVAIDMNVDACLFEAPRNPPDTETRYTRGTDLYAHKARSGNWYFYTFSWSMWQGEESVYTLVDEDEARALVLERAGKSGWEALSDAEKRRTIAIWPDIFDETA
jgi:hypothetical protein